MEEKKCSKCGEVKSVEQFEVEKENKDGHRNKCRECRKKDRREFYKKYPEKGKEANRKWRKKNPGIIKESTIKRRETWKIYLKLKYGEDPICAICGKAVDFFTGICENSVYWDHRNGGNEKIKNHPCSWFYTHQYTEKNISIWESCNFGILCNQCNKSLPTKNRESWLDKISQYVHGRA